MPIETIRVGSFPTDEGGQKIEPEQQPVERLQDLPINVSLGHASPDGNGPVIERHLPGAKLATSVLTTETALETAVGLLRSCQNCKNYDPQGWIKAKREGEAKPNKGRFDEMNAIRAALLDMQSDPGQMSREFTRRHAKPDGLMDIEGALNDLGCCRALQEIDPDKDWIFVFPTGRCPENAEYMFVPLRGALAKNSAAGYDEILTLAGRNK